MNNIKQYLTILYWTILKTLVTKDDMVKSKDFIEEQSNPANGITSKITTLEEKVNSREASICRSNVKVGSLEEKQVYLE